MSNDADYTITTITTSFSQRSGSIFSQAGNNTISLREKCSPYTVVPNEEGEEDEAIIKFPFGCLTGST